MPKQPRKLSDNLKEMSERLLRHPDAAHSSEAAHVALMFANIAWNECVGLDPAREGNRSAWESAFVALSLAPTRARAAARPPIIRSGVVPISGCPRRQGGPRQRSTSTRRSPE